MENKIALRNTDELAARVSIERPKQLAGRVQQIEVRESTRRHFSAKEVEVTIEGGGCPQFGGCLNCVMKGGGFKVEKMIRKVDIKARNKDAQALDIAYSSNLIQDTAMKFIKLLRSNGWDATMDVSQDIGIVWPHWRDSFH